MMTNKQACNECRYVDKCYSVRASPRNIVINILACRIRLGINSNKSARLLLDMVKPNIIKLVKNAVLRVGSGYIDMDTMIMDLESRIIESLISDNGYKIGESAYLTEYLFGTNPRTGWVKKWILWNFQKNKRFYSKHNLLGSTPQSDSSEDIVNNDRNAILNIESEYDIEEEFNNRDIVKTILDIIDDGVTLNANEYRVMAFCMSHVNDSNKIRLIDGTHTHLSRVMGVSRPRVTRLYAVARRKLIDVINDKNIELW